MRTLLIIAIIITSCSSCEKIIDVSLNDATPQMVVVGNLRQGAGDFNVTVSKSGGFYATGNPAKVTGAKITLQKNNDVPVLLTHAGNGEYKLNGYAATASNNYTLRVEESGKMYTASSFLPPRVMLDSITYEFQPATVFVEEGYLIYCELNDPPGVKNYYRLILTVNDRLRNNGTDLFVFNDELTDGRHIKIPLFLSRFKAQDKVSIELVSIDEKVYKYFETLATIVNVNGQQPAAPANPLTNWSPEILGYFSATSSSAKTIILP
jgi:hypothetical protein